MADSLGFRLSLDSKEFEIKIDNAGRLLNRLSNQGTKASTGVKRLEGGFKSFGRTLSDTVTTIGMASFAVGTLKSAFFDWQKTILDSAGKLERLQVMLQGLATSSDKAAESMRDFNYIVDMAKNAPYSIDAISDSFVKLKSAGIDPTRGSLQTMIDATARFGGTSELLKRSTIAIQQMAGKGVISMEELRQQLGEAVPTAMKAMATSMNISMADLVKQISNGQVRAKEAIDGMLAIMEVQYAGSAKRMMNTYSGLVSQMQTNAALLAKTIGDAGYMDAVKDALRDINTLLTSDAAEYYGKMFGDAIKDIIASIREMTVWVVDNQSMLTSLFETIVKIAGAVIFISFIKTVVGSLASLNRSIASVINGGAGLIAFGRNMVQVARRSRSMGGSLNVGSVAIGRMTRAWRGLNAAMKANIIVAAITTIIEVLSVLAWWFDKNKEKAEDAAEAARNMPSMVTDQQLEELRKTQKEQEKLVKEYQAHEQGWLKSIEKKKGKKGLQNIINKDLQGLKKVREQLAKYQADLEKSNNLVHTILIAREEKAARKKIEVMEIALQKERELRQADFKTKVDELDKQQQLELAKYTNNAEKQKEIREKFGDQMRAVYVEALKGDKQAIETQKTLLTEQLKKLQDDLAKAKAGVTGQITNDQQLLISSLETQIISVNSGLNALKTEYDNVLVRLTDSVNLFKGGIIDINGTFTQAITNELTNQLDTLAKNEERMAIGTRIRNGEQIRMIDGRIAKTEEEAEANFKILENLKEQGIEGEKLVSFYQQASEEQKKQIDRALKYAAIRGQDNLARSSSKSAESKAEKAKREAERMAEAHRKILNDADAMSAKIGFGSKEVVKYQQSLEELRKSLEKLSNLSPQEGILSQKQIDDAKAALAEIKAEGISNDYLNALEKDSADQLISKWAGFADTVKSNMTQSVAEMRSEFEKNYQEADKYFDKIIKAHEHNEELTRYLKAEQAKFHAGKEEAMVRMTETATAKMAYDYQNLGKLIDDNFKNIFDNLEDKLMEFLDTGKFNIADFGNFIFKELQRSFIRSMVISPMINGLGLGAGGDTGESMLSKIGGTMGSIGSSIGGMFSGDTQGGDDGTAKSMAALGKASTETTSALETMQSEGILSTLGGYAQQLWAMITGTTATQSKSAADVSATSTITTFAGALGAARGAVMSFIASLTTSGSASTASSVVSMVGTIGSAAASAYGGGAAAGAGAGATASIPSANVAPTTYNPAQYGLAFAFANGGIMGSSGEIPLKTYSKGGIANSPQLALFGEGSHNEAYVPLPDGRSIPVSMNIAGSAIGEGGGSDKNVVISISVVNQGENKEEKSSSSDESAWNGMAQKIKSIVLETMTEEKRPGGVLTE